MKKAHLAFCIAFVTFVGMTQFARAADPTHPDQPSVAPAEAISKLKEGNGRYTGGSLQHPGQTTDRRTELANVQHPFAVIVSCSDSRVPPEIVFDQGLGDVFVTRLAGTSTRTDRSDRVFATPRLVRFTEMEYALPRPVAADAVRAIKATAERYAINFPIEVRFVAPDDALLSPAHERETVYIAVHAFKGMEWEPYFRAVEAIADEHGGRPHWGKRHFQSAATLAPRYPGWERFAAVRARLDPGGLFSNAYTDRVLGPAV